MFELKPWMLGAGAIAGVVALVALKKKSHRYSAPPPPPPPPPEDEPTRWRTTIHTGSYNVKLSDRLNIPSMVNGEKTKEFSVTPRWVDDKLELDVVIKSLTGLLTKEEAEASYKKIKEYIAGIIKKHEPDSVHPKPVSSGMKIIYDTKWPSVIMLDISGSTGQQDHGNISILDTMKDAAKKIIKEKDGNVWLITYDARINDMFAPETVSKWTDKEWNAIQPAGASDTGYAIRRVLDYLCHFWFYYTSKHSIKISAIDVMTDEDAEHDGILEGGLGRHWSGTPISLHVFKPTGNIDIGNITVEPGKPDTCVACGNYISSRSYIPLMGSSKGKVICNQCMPPMSIP